MAHDGVKRADARWLEQPCQSTCGRGKSATKNLVVVSLGFFLLFTSYMSAQNLQSSLNSDQSLGVISLSVIYGALILGCFFLPSPVIKLLGLKRTMIASMSLYTFYFLANFSPSFYTMIPTSIVLGLGGSTLWPAKCSYLSELSTWGSSAQGQSPEDRLATYFGVFFGIFQCAQVSGNVISYLILKPTEESEVQSNASRSCGSSFCESTWTSHGNGTGVDQPEMSQVHLLFGVYAGVCLLAVVMLAVGLDPVHEKVQTQEPARKLLWKAVIHLGDPRQLLMIPITIYSGLEQAYIFSDFTKAFVTCDWGVYNVGYVMICFGACNSVTCFCLGRLVRRIGRIPLITLASLLDAACILTMLLAVPASLDSLFALAGLWGAADAVWQSQINTHYGVLFDAKRKEGFAHYRLWESVGFIVAFAYSPHLCIRPQLYLLLASLAFGFLCYLPTALRPKLTWTSLTS